MVKRKQNDIYRGQEANMKLIISEKQEQYLIGMLLNEEKNYPVEPAKVLVVKKYLDKNFIRGNFSNINANGDIENSPIAGMKNPKTGKVEVNLYKSGIQEHIPGQGAEDEVPESRARVLVQGQDFRRRNA